LFFCSDENGSVSAAESTKVNEPAAATTTTDKQDSGRPIGERQSPDGQEEPKSDSNLALKASGGKINCEDNITLNCNSEIQIQIFKNR
jgi:hypothetical protein